MERHVSEYRFTQSQETISRALAEYLQKHGYRFRSYEYENVYQKGNALLTTSPCFIKPIVSQGTLRIEAWCKTNLCFGILVGERKPVLSFKRFLAELEQFLLSLGCQCISPGTLQKSAGQKEYLRQLQGVTQQAFIKQHLPSSLMQDYRTCAIVCYVLCAFGCLSGLFSNLGWFVVIHAITAAAALVMQQTKNLAASCITATFGGLLAVLNFLLGVTSISTYFLYVARIGFQTISLIYFVFSMIFVICFSLWTSIACGVAVSVYKQSRFYKQLQEKGAR